MTDTFHVQPVGAFHTVILTRDGEVKGGDHHWVSKEAAERAIRLYEVDPEAHGLTESKLRQRHWDHFRKAMFAS